MGPIVAHFPTPPTRILVLGSSGKGKTSFIVDRLINRVYRGLIDKIYIISSTAYYDNTYKRIRGDITRFTEYFPSLINAIMKREHKKYNNTRRVLLYFDDVGGQGIDIAMRPGDPFAKLTSISRHIGKEISQDLGWVVIFACQCMSMVPTVYRKNCDKVVMFYEDNPEERRWLWRTYGFCNEKNFASFMHDNLREKHDFLYLSKDLGFPSWYKNMNIPLAKEVEDIKEQERLARKRSITQAIKQVGTTTPHGPNKKRRRVIQGNYSGASLGNK